MSGAVTLLLAVAANGQQVVSCRKGTECHSWSVLAGSCADNWGAGWVESDVPCTATTPTPTPTPTPAVSPTPTPRPITYTVTPLLAPADLGYNYLMGVTMQGGVLWGNGGWCCPGIGSNIGECIWSIDYNVSPPLFREWWCTYRDTSQLWESGSVQTASSDRWTWVVAGQATYRPAVAALQPAWKDAHVWGFGLASLTAPAFGWSTTVNQGALWWPGMMIWPQGILDLQGDRYLYGQVMDQNTADFRMARWAWPDPTGIALWSSETTLTAGDMPAVSGVAVDADGSLIATTGWWPEQHNTIVKVLRSTDQGRTWVETGIQFEAATGHTLMGCGWDHRSGGAVTQPWHLVCSAGTGLGPDTGDWGLADIRLPGTKLPAHWGEKPVKWKAPTP